MFRSHRLHFLLIAWLFVFALLPLGLTTLADDTPTGSVLFETAHTVDLLANIPAVAAAPITTTEAGSGRTPAPSRATVSSSVGERPMQRLLDFP